MADLIKSAKERIKAVTIEEYLDTVTPPSKQLLYKSGFSRFRATGELRMLVRAI